MNQPESDTAVMPESAETATIDSPLSSDDGCASAVYAGRSADQALEEGLDDAPIRELTTKHCESPLGSTTARRTLPLPGPNVDSTTQKMPAGKVFIPITDELLYERPDLITGPLRPYQIDQPCLHWLSIEIEPVEVPCEHRPDRVRDAA